MKRNLFEEIKSGIEEFKNYPTVAELRKRPEYRPSEMRIHETPAFHTIIPPKTTQDRSLQPHTIKRTFQIKEEETIHEIFYYGYGEYLNKL